METNDAMWQQLVQNQMSVLQQKIAAQQQSLHADSEVLSSDADGHSSVADTTAPLLDGKAMETERRDALGIADNKDQAPANENDEANVVVLVGQNKDADVGGQPQGVGTEDVGSERESAVEVGHDTACTPSATMTPLSPASSLVAKWAEKRRKTIGGAD